MSSAFRRFRRHLSPLAGETDTPTTLPRVRMGLLTKLNVLTVGLIFMTAVATTGYLGFLAGPPLIGVVAEAAGLAVGLGLVSGACAFVALKAGALPEASTLGNSATKGAPSATAPAEEAQTTRT